MIGVEAYWEVDIWAGLFRWAGLIALIMAVFFSLALVGLARYLTGKFHSGQASLS